MPPAENVETPVGSGSCTARHAEVGGEQEARWRLALEATDVGAWNVDLLHHTAWRSLRHGQIFGYAEPLPPWSDEAFLQHVLEEDRAGVVQTIEQAVARGEAWYLECRIRRVDGAVRWIWVQGQSIRDAQGQPTGMSGLVRDITAVKAIEESEQHNAERLRQGIRVARLGLFEHDHRTNEIYYSPVMREIFGWGESEPVTLPEITGRILPEDRPAFVAAVQRAHDPAGEGRFSIEFRLRRPDGTMRWASAQSQTTFAGDGPARHPVRTIGALVDITERKAAEEQLRARERRFRALTEKAADDIILLDARGTIVYESPHETPLLGFATGEMTGQPGLELVHAEDLPLARQKLGEMLRSPGATSQGELRLRRKEGGWSWVQFRATNLLHDPAVQAIVVNLHNITERKEAEAALRHLNATLEDQVAERTRALAGSETRYRALVTASSDVLYRMSPDWAEMRHLIGRDFIADTAAPSRTWLEKYIPPDEQQLVMAAIQEAIRTRSVFDLEHRVRRVDGSLGWTHSRAIPILDAAGKVVEWFGMARDITQRKAAEESLRESEARLRAVLDGTPDPVFLKDRDCRLVLANPATFAVIGKPAEACLGKTDEQFYDDPADGRAIMANDHRIMATGQSETVEEVVHAASGPRSYLTTKAPYRDAAGNVIGLIGLARDITERKRAEAALADASRLNQQIITDVRQGIIVYGPDLKYLVWNRFMEDMTGYPASEVLGRHPLEVFPFLRDTGVIECVTEVLAGKEVAAREFPHPQLKTGKPGWVSDQNSPLRNAKGEIVGVIGIVRDITERKEAEEALRASEELFHVIAASTPDHLVVQDAELRYTLVLNPQLGLTERDMLGHTDFDIMPAAEAEQLTRIKRRVLETGQPARVEAAATSQTGGQEYFEGTYVAKIDARGQADGVIGYFRNVTARKLAAQELKELNESLERRVAERTAELQNHSARLALLSDAASALLTATDPVIFLDGIFSRLSSLLGLEVCVHYERLPGTECLRLAVCRGLPDEVTEKIRELKFGQAICGTVAATGQPMVVENVQNTSEPEAMLIRSLGMTAYACYPLLAKGCLVGTLSFGTRQRTSFDTESLSLIQTVCNEVATAIDRKQGEQALRENERVLRLVIDTVPHGIFAKNEDGRFVLANQTMAQFAGLTPEQMAGHTDAELFPATEQLETYRREDLEVIRSGQPKFIPEELHTDAAGRRRILQTTKVPFTVPQTGEPAVLGVAVDITERKQAEDALRYNLKLIQSITDNTAAAIFVTDAQGYITFVNAEAERMFGYTLAELTGQMLHDRLHHHHADGRPFPMKDCPLSKIFTSGETVRDHADIFFRKDGTRVHVSCSSGLLEANGVWNGTVIVLHDITARIEAETALREARDALERRVTERTAELARANEQLRAQIAERSRAEQELRRQAALLNMTSDAIIIWDWHTGLVRYWNHGAERLYEFSSVEAVNRSPHTLLLTDFPKGEAAFLSTLQKEGAWRGELTHTTKTGRKIIVESHHQLVEQPDGAQFVLETNHDITERVTLHDEIVAAGERERERIGQNLHDGLCQLLTAARLKADALVTRLADHEPGTVRSARALAGLMAQSVDDARALARGLEPVEPLPEGLMAALQQLASATSRLFNVACTCEFPRPVLLTDHRVATELFRIAQEATNNAIKHSRASSIRIRCAAEDHELALSILSDGKPFPKRPRAAGMGLKTMRFRAGRIGATLEVKRGPRKGTLVHCAVPLPPANPSPQPRPSAPDPGGDQGGSLPANPRSHSLNHGDTS